MHQKRVQVPVSKEVERMIQELASRIPFATRPKICRFAMAHGLSEMISSPTLLPAALARKAA